jgi:two-component system, LytTR family, response regulator
MELIAIGGFKKALPSDIIFMEAQVNYTKIHFADGEVFRVAYTLKKLAKRFEAMPNFFRASSSNLVNLHHMKDYKKETTEIILLHDHKIKISRRKLMNFKKIKLKVLVK